ncbi:DUF742 domain-containing protein [Streptomonospora wellingtoniae]|uniref:DUF742 domain-containing protein n=1 Tax=Streptomonospora wellingtoniae TaxID=3075544 RepID=A0ABU2KVU5_9ACTN|nr:DUF742 domain-containing protein [Streptomonospora sp. DSM 45055]MDT0303326.1 DUF742 domain-containing protein [Streptomonospora sp. DSM 45055]
MVAPHSRDAGSASWFGQQPAGAPRSPAAGPGGADVPRPTQNNNADQQAAANSSPSSLVRPYAVTKGRTKPKSELPLETLISSTDTARNESGTLTPECQAISDLCREWRSVAEVSALLRIPLGVARVLVADMSEQGLLQITSSTNTDSRPNANLLERVLSGLRKL